MPEIKPSVLLVDDVEANLVALEAILGDMSCDLVRAEGGNEALKQLLKREFAVMLLDVQMPEMDGFEVASFARENPSTCNVPIIFLTAMHRTEESVLRGYGTGAVDFLLKPVNAYVLRAKVRVFLDLYLGRRRLADEVAAHEKTLTALERSNTALRHFTHAASHDLRAPLRAMRGFLGILSEEGGDQLDAKFRDYLDRSCRASQRMDSLLSSLLTYAGLQKPARYVAVNCAALFEQVKTDLAEPLQRSAGTLEVGELPWVRGDTDRLYQLFLNLLSNAIKFRRAEEPLVLRVLAEMRGDEAIICVKDNGIGVDSSYLNVIFDAFRRLHSQSTYEGTGLGLAICKQIVEEHGGRIWVTSEPGRGSQFFVALPLAAGVTDAGS